MQDMDYSAQMEQLKQRMASERPIPWDDLPDIALYMDQVVSYLGRQLITFREGEGLTSAKINNYIKDGIAPRANGKRYEKEHISILTAIAALKQVLSVRDLATLLEHGVANGPPEETYTRFCNALDTALNDTVERVENGPEALPNLAVYLALHAYAEVLACRRILDLLREAEEGSPKDKKKKK